MALQACTSQQASAQHLCRSNAHQKVSSSPSLSIRPAARTSFLGKSLRTSATLLSSQTASKRAVTVCGLDDFIGGDLIGLDLGEWCDDVENYGAIGFWAPPEGGAECRYATSLKYRGYHFMNVSARGLGDIEAYLLKPHGVRPPHLGRQAVARFYYPGEVDLRLSVLAPRYKGIVLWVGEAKVLSKNELQFLAVLPALRPQVKVVCEMGGSRKFNWKPLKDVVGLPTTTAIAAAAAAPVPTKEATKQKEEALA